MRADPFKLADELIRRDYRIPAFQNAQRIEPGGSFVTMDHAVTVSLADVLGVIRRAYYKLLAENDALERKVLDYEPVIREYANRPKRRWSSRGSGNSAEFGGYMGGEIDDYAEARKVWKRHQPKDTP